MKNLNIHTTTSNDFEIMTIEAKYQLSVRQQIDHQENTLLAIYLYNKSGDYTLSHYLVNKEGEMSSLPVNKGILPTYFKSPENETWVSQIEFQNGKEVEQSLPIIANSSIKLPKTGADLKGDYVGSNTHSSFFLNIDIFSEKKQDILIRFDFENKTIKKKQKIKIDFPKWNKIQINNNEIQLFSEFENSFLHRKISDNGEITARRTLTLKKFTLFEAINLDFENTTQIIGIDQENQIILYCFNKNGDTTETTLFQSKQEIYALWSPVKIADKKWIFRFTQENGNGWFVLDNEAITAFYINDEESYVDQISGEKIQLLQNNLVISGLSKNEENSYTLSFYHRDIKNKIWLVTQKN